MVSGILRTDKKKMPEISLFQIQIPHEIIFEKTQQKIKTIPGISLGEGRMNTDPAPNSRLLLILASTVTRFLKQIGIQLAQISNPAERFS